MTGQATQVNQQSTYNFLVPAEGQTNVMAVTLPGSGNLTTAPAAGGGYYGFDFSSFASQQGQAGFIPQAVTIDATSLSSGQFVTFSIPGLNGPSWIINAGQTRTFQFPSLSNLQVLIVPSSGAPSIPCAFYNYPALPDASGSGVTGISGTVNIGTMPDVTIGTPAGGIGTDVSVNPPGLLGTHLASLAANPARKGFLIQNQSAETIQVALSVAGSAPYTVILLLPNSAGAGTPGGSIDFSGCPHDGQIDVYGTSGADQVAIRDF
jgi:hypothetical protein